MLPDAIRDLGLDPAVVDDRRQWPTCSQRVGARGILVRTG
jgi:hypothetical protein